MKQDALKGPLGPSGCDCSQHRRTPRPFESVQVERLGRTDQRAVHRDQAAVSKKSPSYQIKRFKKRRIAPIVRASGVSAGAERDSAEGAEAEAQEARDLGAHHPPAQPGTFFCFFFFFFFFSCFVTLDTGPR